MRKNDSVFDTLSEEVLQLFWIHHCSWYSFDLNIAAPVCDVLLGCFAYYVKPFMFIFSTNLHWAEHDNMSYYGVYSPSLNNLKLLEAINGR